MGVAEGEAAAGEEPTAADGAQHDVESTSRAQLELSAKPGSGALVPRNQLAPHPAVVAGAGSSGGEVTTTAVVSSKAVGSAIASTSRLNYSSSGSSATVCALAIHELNEEAIELIFTFLPPEDRRSAAAVCRLWRRVHNSSTKLWGTVLLSGERIMQAAASSSAGSIVSWLGARLEAMRNVRLWSPSYPLENFASGLAQLLSRENRLQSFSYVCTDASVSRLLGELQGLTSLQLLDILSPAIAPGQGLVVRARELAKLKPLRNLLSLKLCAREIQGSLPPTLFRCLDRLQHLAISAKCYLPATVVRQLTGLQSLELHGASLDRQAAEAAAALQQLTRLGISIDSWRSTADHHHQRRQQEQQAGSQEGEEADGAGGGCRPGPAAPARWQDHPIWGQLPLLARLQQLAVGADLPTAAPMGDVHGPADGSMQGGDGGGEGEGQDGDGSSASSNHHPQPQLGPAILPYDALEGSVPDGIMDCPSLTHLLLPVALTCLPELVPGQLPRLLELNLTHSIVECLPASWCCNMQKLRRLVLNGAPLAGSHLPAEFAALQSLRQLEMRACSLQKLPSCVAQLTGLTYLDLGINRLTGLPGGPYLGRLRHLVLRSNALQVLPPALATAQRLQVLDVGENDSLALQESDVDGLLARMPDLRQLVLSRQPTGLGFGPLISAGNGAAWDVQSVGVLMQLARSLPKLVVQLERTEPPGMQPPPPFDEEDEEDCSRQAQ